MNGLDDRVESVGLFRPSRYKENSYSVLVALSDLVMAGVIRRALNDKGYNVVVNDAEIVAVGSYNAFNPDVLISGPDFPALFDAINADRAAIIETFGGLTRFAPPLIVIGDGSVLRTDDKFPRVVDGKNKVFLDYAGHIGEGDWIELAGFFDNGSFHSGPGQKGGLESLLDLVWEGVLERSFFEGKLVAEIVELVNLIRSFSPFDKEDMEYYLRERVKLGEVIVPYAFNRAKRGLLPIVRGATKGIRMLMHDSSIFHLKMVPDAERRALMEGMKHPYRTFSHPMPVFFLRHAVW